jgi:hypothetical protein
MDRQPSSTKTKLNNYKHKGRTIKARVFRPKSSSIVRKAPPPIRESPLQSHSQSKPKDQLIPIKENPMFSFSLHSEKEIGISHYMEGSSKKKARREALQFSEKFSKLKIVAP